MKNEDLVMMATLGLVLTVGVLTTIYSQQVFAVAGNPGAAGAQVNQTLHIDVPVKLDKAKVVFDIGHLVLWGDAPFFIGDIHLLTSDISQWNIPGQVIAVFHGDAAYLVLNDNAYNINRHVQTGNPYAKAIADLMKQGVQIELCGATAAANHWVNADLLPGVKVNTNAIVRVTQLQQNGYTLIYE
jgi:intracellular sulfur oxidation DsrE/DsrF family protein